MSLVVIFLTIKLRPIISHLIITFFSDNIISFLQKKNASCVKHGISRICYIFLSVINVNDLSNTMRYGHTNINTI